MQVNPTDTVLQKNATDTGSKISGLAGLIGLKSDLALTNLLMGESIKGLSKKGLKANSRPF